ncbi:MAG: TRAM domain-containing protein [Planctomycetes bacterium]|nr:TRAM domain-containing protein [Planctomycetota bacterium]
MDRIVQQTQTSTVSFRRSLLISLVALLFGFAINVGLEALGAFGDRPATLVRSVLLFFTVYFALTLQHVMVAARWPPAGVISLPQGLLVDTSVLIDGRILDIVRNQAIDGPFCIVQPVLDELQQLADSSDKPRRERGRRGLDVLGQLKECLGDRLQVLPPQTAKSFATAVDEHLIRLAVERQYKLLTVDAPLQKRAQAQGVVAINWNELATALKPPCLPGQELTLLIVRRGQQPGQGVGYLEDGTMLVVEGTADVIDREVNLTITGVTQTAGGRMVFGRRTA